MWWGWWESGFIGRERENFKYCLSFFMITLLFRLSSFLTQIGYFKQIFLENCLSVEIYFYSISMFIVFFWCFYIPILCIHILFYSFTPFYSYQFCKGLTYYYVFLIKEQCLDFLGSLYSPFIFCLTFCLLFLFPVIFK